MRKPSQEPYGERIARTYTNVLILDNDNTHRLIPRPTHIYTMKCRVCGAYKRQGTKRNWYMVCRKCDLILGSKMNRKVSA